MRHLEVLKVQMLATPEDIADRSRFPLDGDERSKLVFVVLFNQDRHWTNDTAFKIGRKLSIGTSVVQRVFKQRRTRSAKS